jgi:hypothetical protein
MLVCFRKQLYIKFPPDYVVIRTEHGYATGQISTKTIDYTYATCFDTRTYSYVRPRLERKADSADMMQMIQQCTNETQSCFTWPSTTELTEHSKSWIYKIDRNVMISKWVSSVILKDLETSTNLTQTDQQNMYTLPDLFSYQPDKQAQVVKQCQNNRTAKQDKDQKHDHQWTEDIKQHPLDTELAWMKLRCTTRNIAADGGILMAVDSNIEHNLLKGLLRDIRSKMLTASSMDKS